MVSVENPSGGIADITEKKAMEKAIMDSNDREFNQSHHRPFYKEPLSTMFGFKGITTTAVTVLAPTVNFGSRLRKIHRLT